MEEIEEKDILNQNEEEISFEYCDGIKLFEDYRNSNYSKDYINELDEKDQCIIGHYIQLISDSFNIKLENRNIDLICKIAIAYLKSFEADEANIFYANKEYNMSIFLSSNILLNSICRYVLRCKYNEIVNHISSLGKQEINYDNGVKFDIERIVNITYLLKMLFPYLYDDNEIETFISQFVSINNTEEKVNFLINFASASANRIKNEYQYTREFYEEVEKCIKEFYYSKLITPLGQRYLKLSRRSLETSRFIVFEFIEEYNRWKIDNNSYPDAFPSIRYFYWPYYLFIDKQLLYYFFETLNERHAFDKTQIEYILEMAPKLRIASYLNEEYAKYKKLYNPDAREFDFGVDEPEEETTIEEQLLPESEQIEEEKKEKRYLDRLSHFTKPKLIKLLKKFRDRKEPFVHKETKNKNWLFVFGMNGDTPPKGFEKNKWEAKHNGRIAKGALIDFLELLGYDINQLYEVDSIKILNECFECYNPDNKLVPIDQNDFHYNKRTKERKHSKTFYDHFKRIIENIEKEA